MGSMKDALGDEPAESFYGRYPRVPGFKAIGTSSDAARATNRSAGNLRELALAAIKGSRVGLTADEVAKALNKSVLAIRPRISELLAEKPPRIRRSGERRANESGLHADVYIA